jgi:hypothetical protein
VFESPHRLHLQLFCNAKTPVKKTLNVWPRSFPIVIQGSGFLLQPQRRANFIAALRHHDRVSEIDLKTITSTLSERLSESEVLNKPYPVLTRLRLEMVDGIWMSAPVLPDTFLGGSYPRLKYLEFWSIPFPALPKFLRFCHDLDSFQLWRIPNTGYFSPEALATALSSLTKLNFFYIEFKSPASRPDPGNRLPSSLTRIVLPSLISFTFHGASEYFEDLVARIDTPAIISVRTRFFNQLDFDIRHFVQFIGRTWIPGSFENAELYLFSNTVTIDFRSTTIALRSTTRRRSALSIWISCHGLDWQVACIAQICGKISPFLSNVEELLIRAEGPEKNVVFSDWEDYVDNPQWLEIFHAFPASKYMHIPPKLGEIVASALLELTGERVMEALPRLRHLYLKFTSTQQALQPFISSRQRSNHPVTVHVKEPYWSLG